MIKTVTLSGAEVCVTGLGGQNVIVKNLSSDAVYASAGTGVEQGADGVAEIPAGGGEVLLDVNGTVYLKGTGSVQVTGTNYATPNFKQPSRGGDELYGEAEFFNSIDEKYAYTVPVAKGSTGAETASNYATALADILGEHWVVDGTHVAAESGEYIEINFDNNNIKIKLHASYTSSVPDESYNVNASNDEHYIDVIKSKSRSVLSVAFLHDVLINYTFIDYDTPDPIIWQRGKSRDFYRAGNNSIVWKYPCSTNKAFETSLGTTFTDLRDAMYNMFSISCDESFLESNPRVFMRLNGKNYAIFGKFNTGILSNTNNYNSLLAIPLDG